MTQANKPHYLSVLAVFKNEAHILVEWIEHYLARGFQHFYLINDHSTDQYLSLLQHYLDRGLVTLFQNEVEGDRCGRQQRVYETYCPAAVKESEWLAVLDLDEFLYSPLLVKLNGFFLTCQLKDVSQVVVDWVHFGSSGFIEQPKNVVASFTQRVDVTKNVEFSGTKAIFQTKYLSKIQIHEHEMSHGRTIRVGWSVPKQMVLLVNHYAIQSLEFFMNVKATRGDVNRYLKTTDRNLELFRRMDLNHVQDLRLARQTGSLLEQKPK